MIRVIRVGRNKWGINWNKNSYDRRFLRINTPFGSIGFVFSSGNGYLLREPTKKEQEAIKKYEKRND